MDWLFVVYIAAAAVVGLAIGVILHKAVVTKRLGDADGLARRIVLEARKEAQAQKKEIILQGKDDLFNQKREQENEFRERERELKAREHKLEDVSSRVPFYIPADSPAIRTLIDTYNEVTGEDKEPFTMGGGTYARHFPFAVSFGPEHTDIPLPDFAGPMHGANEGANFDKMIEALKIYILALLRLQELEF